MGNYYFVYSMKNNIISKLKKPIYMGNRVYCPVCERKSRAFAPFGYIHRRYRARCIWCGSLERHRLVIQYIKRNVFPRSNKVDAKFLHIAPEDCLKSYFKNVFHGKYITSDIEMDGVDLKFDLMDIPFGDSHFDLIYCSHVLEHVNDDFKAMRELYRVLSKTGIAIILVPITAALKDTIEGKNVTDLALRTRLFGQPDHLRRYGLDFPERLKSVGFSVDAVKAQDFLTPAEVVRNGTLFAGRLSETIFICQRAE